MVSCRVPVCGLRPESPRLTSSLCRTFIVFRPLLQVYTRNVRRLSNALPLASSGSTSRLPQNPEQTGLGKRLPMRDIALGSYCSCLAAVPTVRSPSTDSTGRFCSAWCTGGYFCVVPAAHRFGRGEFHWKVLCGLSRLDTLAASRAETSVSGIWRPATASTTCPRIPSV